MILLQLKIYHDSGLVVELAFQGCRKSRGEAFKKTLIYNVGIVKFIFKDMGLGLNSLFLIGR